MLYHNTSRYGKYMGQTLTRVERKPRKQKDKDAPKKPISAFFCYQKLRRQALKNESSLLNNKELVAVSGFERIENVGRMA